MNKLSALLMLLALSSAPVYAQHDKDSGSGNGTFDRAAIAYEGELKEADLNLSSWDETFDRLKEQIKSLSKVHIQPINVSDDFWENFSEQDQATVLEVDKFYLDLIEKFTKDVSDLKETVKNEQEKLEGYLKSAKRYEEYDQKSNFKKFIKGQKESTQEIIKGTFASSYKELIPVWYVNDDYEGKVAYANYIFPSTLTIGKKTFNFQMMTSPEQQFAKCSGILCVKEINKIILSYWDVIDELGDIKINVLGVNSTLKKNTKKYLGGSNNQVFRLGRKDLKRLSFKRMTEIQAEEMK